MTVMQRRFWGFCAVVGLVSAYVTVHAQQPRLTWLGVLPGGNFSLASAVSANGDVVVGWSDTGAGFDAFRWTPNTGMVSLGRASQFAYGVSRDGSVVVGSYLTDNLRERAFRWTEAQGLQDLGTLPGGDTSVAYSISADGQVIVGYATNAVGGSRAFRVVGSGALEDLGQLGGGFSRAFGVSNDGSVVVGHSVDRSGRLRAFRWSAVEGMRDIGGLPSGISATAFAASEDGTVVVGESLWAGPGWRACRWTPSGIQNLGIIVGSLNSRATAVSADGSIIVGATWTRSLEWDYAFRWRELVGIENLNDVYAQLIQDGSILKQALGISPDGRYIVGQGFNASTGRLEGFLLDTVPEPASMWILSVGLATLLRRLRRKP